MGIGAGLTGSAIVWRGATFLVFWLILVGGVDPADRPAGILAIATATWVSLRLLPAGGRCLVPTALARLTLRFFRQSIVAGVDVAWRALDPRLPLRPGFVVYPARLSPPALQALCTLTSLSPGTLPAEVNADQGGQSRPRPRGARLVAPGACAARRIEADRRVAAGPAGRSDGRPTHRT